MIFKKCYLFLLVFISFVANSQYINGKVFDASKNPIANASVYWTENQNGIFTDQQGNFLIKKESPEKKFLKIFKFGFALDSIAINTDTPAVIILNKIQKLNEIIIKKKQSSIVLSNITPAKTEIISQVELKKAACCDLSGCFETQLSVQPQTTNVITNSKELRILGLSGVYNQVLVDGFPMIQALSYTYGISTIPGTIVDKIYVSKGANSVLQGFESISGQVNVETKDPDKTDKLFLNFYINNFAEKHFNANFAVKKKKWSNLTALHVVQPANKFDRDDDSFLDLPLLTRYMIMNKTAIGNENEWGWSSSVGIRYVNETRIGGQQNYNPEVDKGSNKVYGQLVYINQPEFWSKTSYKINDSEKYSFYISSFHQNQKSFLGTVKYDAEQFNFFANLQNEFIFSEKQSLKTGISFKFFNLKENIEFTHNSLPRSYNGLYTRRELIAGIFAEHSVSFFNNKLLWIAGIRGDNHNQFGFTVTPRTLLKYDFSTKTVLRLNIGMGWRTANLFSENIGLLISSRNIIFNEILRPERATNIGLSFTQKFAKGDFSGSFTTDLYRTQFQNQIFPDHDADPTKAIVQNFEGKSISNGFQSELFLKFWQKFEFKIGYNFLDVYRIVDNRKIVLPFNPAHKFITTFSYKPISNKFHLDANIHWYGQQRLPSTQSNPAEFRRNDYSDAFTLVNMQFTYIFKKFEIYSGSENILNFRQLQPIISWENPFGQYFDTSFVWGPTRGRELYMGLRYKIF